MLDPYRMIVVNIIASFVVLGIIFVYKYVKPKKNPSHIFTLLLLSILPVISILRKGVYESGDFVDHIKGTQQFFISLQEQNFIPRLSGLNCNGYTCPDFIFHYLSPHYILSFFHSLGLSFIASEKLFFILIFYLSGIFMYFWLKEEFNKKAAFVGSIFYIFAPYHLVDLHFRNAIGELMGFMLLPLVLLFSLRLVKSGKIRYFLGLSLLIALLIISHQVISVISIPIIGAYVLIKWQQEKQDVPMLIKHLTPIVLGVLLTTFYWLPLVYEQKYIAWGTSGQINLLSIKDLLYSPWRWGFLFQGPYGELSFLLGYAQLAVIALIVYLLLSRKIKEKSKLVLIFFTFSFFVLAFLMTDLSSFLWEKIFFFKFFGFSYRFLIFESIFISFMAAYVVTKIKNNILIVLLSAFAIFSTILNWGNRRTIPEINDATIQKELETEITGKNNITLPIWVKGDYYYINGRVKKHIEVISGKSQIKEIERTTTRHEYLILVNKKSQFVENTFYFPGWKLYVNNKSYPFEYNVKPNEGIMYFKLNPGLYKVDFIFEDTKDRDISKQISIISLIVLVIISFLNAKYPKALNKFLKHFPKFGS